MLSLHTKLLTLKRAVLINIFVLVHLRTTHFTNIIQSSVNKELFRATFWSVAGELVTKQLKHIHNGWTKTFKETPKNLIILNYTSLIHMKFLANDSRNSVVQQWERELVGSCRCVLRIKLPVDQGGEEEQYFTSYNILWRHVAQQYHLVFRSFRRKQRYLHLPNSRKLKLPRTMLSLCVRIFFTNYSFLAIHKGSHSSARGRTNDWLGE